MEAAKATGVGTRTGLGQQGLEQSQQTGAQGEQSNTTEQGTAAVAAGGGGVSGAGLKQAALEQLPADGQGHH